MLNGNKIIYKEEITQNPPFKFNQEIHTRKSILSILEEDASATSFPKEIILPKFTTCDWNSLLFVLSPWETSESLFFDFLELQAKPSSGDQSRSPQIVSPPFGIIDIVESHVRVIRMICCKVWSPRKSDPNTPGAIALYKKLIVVRYNPFLCHLKSKN